MTTIQKSTPPSMQTGAASAMQTSATYLKHFTLPCTRRALALAYFPDARPDRAVRRLHCWIKRCKPLYTLLTAGDASFDRRKIITVREATLIMEYLGEPGEEP